MFETEERRSRRRISIKLVSSCWSCSSNTNNKIVEIWVEEEDIVKLELICVALGLDPCQPQAATLKLNRHLISNNNSSLTWKSLLSFFASRGLPIGSSSNDPLIIHYENHLHLLPQTNNNKRGHDPCCTQNWDTYSSGIKQNAEPQDVNFFKKQKIDNNNAGTHISSSGRDGDHQTTRFNGFSLKRKPTVEDVSMFMLKKRKLNEGNPGNQSSTPNTISESQLGCSCISGSKRPREGS